MEVGAQQLRDKIAVRISNDRPQSPLGSLYMSSKGEMKMSLRLMILMGSARMHLQWGADAYIFMAEVL